MNGHLPSQRWILQDIRTLQQRSVPASFPGWVIGLVRHLILHGCMGWVSYRFVVPNLEKGTASASCGVRKQQPIMHHFRQSWTDSLQNNFDRFGPGLSLKIDEWINACTHSLTHTHECTVNLPGHINRAGVLSNAPLRTWISASQNRGGKREEGEAEEEIKDG